MFNLDLFSLVSIASYGLLVLITVAAAPKQDFAEARQRQNLAWVALGTILAYAASSPWLFLAGWTASLVPVWLDKSYGPGPKIVNAMSVVAIAFGLLAAPGQSAAFLLLVLAAIMRKGVVPFQFWIPAAFETGSLPVLSLLLNGHLGAFLVIRFAVPLFPEAAAQYLSLLGILAILTSLYGAVVALVSRKPRRTLALLCASQAAFILAGLENRNVEGITGALLHWWVVAFATATLLAVYRSIEARSTEAAGLGGYLGFGYHAPRLAVFFAVGALALIGLPGTLGFAAEDLLFHGALESHPLLGFGLPLATALNAITALRLLAMLFFGRRGIHVPSIADALPRERWALTVPVVLLVAGGVFPAVMVALRAPVAGELAALLGGR